MKLNKLPKTFPGGGEVEGHQFTQVFENDKGYVYKVDTGSSIYYEAFFKKQNSVCIDFAKRIYSDTEFKETYPKSKSFGIWAYTVKTLDKGIEKLTTKTNYESY